MGSRGSSARSQKMTVADRKRLTSGDYDVKQSMGVIHSLEMFSIKQAMRDNVGDAPATPSGLVSAKTQELAQKGLRWYDANEAESLKAEKAYKAEAKKFNSKEVKRLLIQQADRWGENARQAASNKEWYRRAYGRYL